MAAATIKKRYITCTGAPAEAVGATWIERVFISDLGAGSPSTFTSHMRSVDGGLVNLAASGTTPTLSIAGKTVSVHFASPADDNQPATVVLFGVR